MNGIWVWLGVAVVLLLLLAWLLRIGWRARQADWGSKLLNSLDGLTRLFCKHYHRFKFDKIWLPEKGGALLASNHLSGLDPLLLTCAINKPLRFMIATEQYNKPLLRWMYKGMGTIPVDRAGASEKAFYTARQALQEGELIGVFPQGGIRHPEESVPLKRGVVLLADLAKAPIIPIRLSGISGVGRVISAVFMRSNARLETGPPIWVNGPRDKQALEALNTFFSDGSGKDDAPLNH